LIEDVHAAKRDAWIAGAWKALQRSVEDVRRGPGETGDGRQPQQGAKRHGKR
jgi:hypothetical protein